MLTHIHISDFTLVENLDLELSNGLTTITGETGAGKSILLGALALALGDRSDADKVRPGAAKTEISASFDLSKLKFAQKWLEDNDLCQSQECILRRVITAEGRSRAYINGKTVPLQQLRFLGENLIDIHSQHAHQSLLSNTTHRRLLDEFGSLEGTAKQVKEAYKKWRECSEKLAAIQSQSDDLNARFQLLSYQVDELNQLDLNDGELEALEAEQRKLANLESTKENCQHVSDICSSDGVGLLDRIHTAIHLLEDLNDKSETLNSAESMLRNAVIQIQEAHSEVEHYIESEEEDASRLPEIELRLSQIYDISRKHRVPPEDLVELHTSLAEELASLQSGDEQTEELERQIAEYASLYQTHANKLTTGRARAAKKLGKAVNTKLQQLAMERAEISITLIPTEDALSAHGNESVELMISTNPGQPPKPLAKIASGGELSRVSLAIQVVTAQTSTTPTLVFDEVDVGIGGVTGDVVGRMLRELGEDAQILCVTHLAQVASKGHNHLLVDKVIDKKGASTNIKALKGEEKVQEIARMMGGAADSKRSLAHAKEMIKAG